ncbi:MAG: PAS domain-containing protein [Deltaproteobacteria bacterium]|nr:PAS domain-containing protein [Deltaproteobacteria bacterium]
MLPVRKSAGPLAAVAHHFPSRSRLAVLLIWAGVAIPLFLAFELVERAWLQGLPARNLWLAHVVRGLGVSLVVGFATAAYMFWRALPQLEKNLDTHARVGSSELRQGFVTWLVGLRWVAVLALIGVVAYATLVTGRVPPGQSASLWGGVAALAVFNTVLFFVPARRLASQALLSMQVCGDVLILGWLVHHSGGMANPFAGLFVFHAVIAGTVLEPRNARGAAVAVSVFIMVLTLAEASGVLPPFALRSSHGAMGIGDDAHHIMASGLTVSALAMGCAMIVVTLVQKVQSDHDRLFEATTSLASERGKLQAIIDCMADAVVYVDPDGQVKLHNRAAETLWPEGMPKSSDLRVCHHPETWARLRAQVANPSPLEVHPTLTVGNRVYEATYAPVEDDEKLSGVVMVARDVTERIEQHKWQMQEERMAVVGKLAAGLAHELNNPLGAIALFTQHTLGRLRPDDPMAENLGTVLRNANLCKKIVRDLLAYARQRPPERVHVDPIEIIADVERTLTPQAEQSGVVIRRDVSQSGNMRIYGDPDQLRQVLVNLGLNAIEAMQGLGELVFRVVSEDGEARFDVVDTGPGISADEQERIFSAFYTTKAEGTGLGLTVARDIVAAHGGVLKVASAEGKGSTFSVRLRSVEEVASPDSGTGRSSVA